MAEGDERELDERHTDGEDELAARALREASSSFYNEACSRLNTSLSLSFNDCFSYSTSFVC